MWKFENVKRCYASSSACFFAVTFVSACSRSFIRSCASSRPTERRMRLSETPAARRFSAGMLRMFFHPEVQGFYATYNQPTIMRRKDGAAGILDELYFFSELLCFCNDQSCDEITMAAEVLGGAVYDNVCTELNRLLQGGGG